MKNLLTLLLLLTVTVCFAQQHIPATNTFTTAAYDSIMHRAHKYQTGAVAGFVSGTMFTGGGVALIVLGTTAPTAKDATIDYAVGSAILATGVVAFAMGGYAYHQFNVLKKAAQKLKGTAYLHMPAPYATARGGGVSWRVTF
jgi:hypothetical protein